MAEGDTLVLRVALAGESATYRDIEIESSKSLYRLAEAIIAAFGFDFDHCFGFYTGAPYGAKRKHPMYELFADMGEADPGVLSVKKTKIEEAFPAAGHVLTFLFDYGDDWLFRVKLTGTGKKVAKVRYPRVVASKGEAPKQYPDPDEEPEEGPRYGVG
jgi:hypothetical protein